MSRFRKIGPGAIVAAAFIGPGTVTTATISGASYGFTLLWAILFSVFATYILQEMSARLGLVGQMGVGEAIRVKLSNGMVKLLATVLVVSAILIGNAAYEAGNISGAALGISIQRISVLSIEFNPSILVIGIVAALILSLGKHQLIERTLIAMVSIMGFVFILSAYMLSPNMLEVVEGLFVPKILDGGLLLVVGLIGTTVVPYNIFLHASFVKKKWHLPEDISNVRADAFYSILIGGFITMSILIASAVVNQHSDADIRTITDMSSQLEPLLGSWATTFMSIGFLAAGLSSAITAPLAAAFASSELFGWGNSMQSNKFRAVWIVILSVGIVFSLLGFRPTSIILFAQVANGFLLPIIATFLLWVMNDKKLLGKYTNTFLANIFGGIILLITIVLGVKGIITAF
jgi:manganese transport protein